MFAHVHRFRAMLPAGGAQGFYSNAAAQSRLAFLLALNLMAVAASFSIENFLLPWQSRMDATTPGWCFVLAQASTIGVVAAIVGITLGVMLLKVEIAYTLTGDELTAILMQASRRAAAYGAGATLNGLALRGLGFRWLVAANQPFTR